MKTKNSALRLTYLFLTLGIMTVNIAMAALHWERGGWDVKHHCVCSEKIVSGTDPYLEQAQADLPASALRCTYPPFLYQIIYHLFICPFNPRLVSLMMSLAAVVLLGVMLKPQGLEEILFTAALLTCGFSALRNIMLSGNIVSLEFFLFGMALIFLVRGHQSVSGVVMALAGSIKIQPIALGAGLAYMLPRNKIAGFLGALAAAVLIIFMGSLFANPELFSSYAGFLYGTIIEDASTGLVEGGPSYDLSAKNFIKDVAFLVFGIAHQSPIPFLLWLVGVGYFLVRLKKKSWTDEEKLSVAAILLLLAFPRLKNYTYILMTVPLVILYRKEPLVGQCIILAVLNVIPLALLVFFDMGFQLNSMTGKTFYFLITYSNFYAALLALYLTWRRLNERNAKHLTDNR